MVFLNNMDLKEDNRSRSKDDLFLREQGCTQKVIPIRLPRQKTLQQKFFILLAQNRYQKVCSADFFLYTTRSKLLT